MVFPLHTYVIYVLCAQDSTAIYVFIYFVQSKSDISAEFPSLYIILYIDTRLYVDLFISGKENTKSRTHR